jgi:hypothetical protein
VRTCWRFVGTLWEVSDNSPPTLRPTYGAAKAKTLGEALRAAATDREKKRLAWLAYSLDVRMEK